MDMAEEIVDPLITGQCMNNDDLKFCSFYYKAIKRLLDIENKTNASYFNRYFKIFSEYYDFWCKVKLDLQHCDNDIIKLLKDSLYYRMAFVYKTATLLSSAVAFHFRNTHKQSPKNIERLARKRLVKICSLGGCSASDVVAFVTVLESIALESGIELDFRVTIIESDERWMATCITLLSCLKQFHKATWKITFNRCDLTQKNAWTTQTFEAIQGADIISMVRFITTCNLKEEIIKKICENMQPRSVLFVLDHPTKEVVDLSFGITNFNDFELIYTELFDFHPLDIEAVKHFQTLFQKHFADQKHFRPNASFNLFVSVWIKANPESCLKFEDKIKCMLRNNVEKYNPRQSSLSSNAVTKWENLFTKQKEAAGWSAKGIRKFMQVGREKRNSLLVELIDEKKTLDVLQKNLISIFQSQDKEKNKFKEVEVESLKMYLFQKSHYSLKKRFVYYSPFH